jgi:hypothetical protein
VISVSITLTVDAEKALSGDDPSVALLLNKLLIFLVNS